MVSFDTCGVCAVDVFDSFNTSKGETAWSKTDDRMDFVQFVKDFAAMLTAIADPQSVQEKSKVGEMA